MPRAMTAGLTLFLAGLATGCTCWPCAPKPPQPGTMPPAPEHPVLEVVEVEDAVEAALLEQEIGLRPVKLDGRLLYYVPDPEVARRLTELEYQPRQVDGVEVYERVMRVTGGGEEGLREAGVTVLLREDEYRVVHGTIQQLRVLARLGYRLEELRQEPRPRQVRVLVASAEDVRTVAESGVDVYSAGPAAATEQRYPDRGYVVYGGAFDDAIDRLRRLEFDVEILPDPPEVVR